MDIEKQYEKIGKAYIEGQGSFFSKKEDQAKQFIKDNLPNLKGKTVLDIGCGQGKDIARYEAMGAKEVFGIDSSEFMISEANKIVKHPERLTVASMEKLPFENQKFDVLVGRFSLHYIKNLDKTYEEFSRVLKKEGVLVFIAHHPFLGFMQLGAKKYDSDEIISMKLYDDAVTIQFPHHTLKSYFSDKFFEHFSIDYMTEENPEYAEYHNKWRIPGFIGFKAIKK